MEKLVNLVIVAEPMKRFERKFTQISLLIIGDELVRFSRS